MRKLLLMLSIMFASPLQAMDLPDADSAAAQLFSERCSTCHALPHPKRMDWQHWQHMLRVMKRRVDERGMDMPAEEWRMIAGYLKEHAR